MSTKTDVSEALIVHQGFEYRISNFTIDDFRGDKLPNFNDPENSRYRSYYRIEKYEKGSRCPWGKSRWITGKNGKLMMLDNDWDTSG